MTYEDIYNHCMREIDWFERVRSNPLISEVDCKRYEEHKMVAELIEKADKYRWHNIRKNPNDLPNTYNQVLVCWRGGSSKWYDVMFYNDEKRLFERLDEEQHCIIGDERFCEYGEVIGWREIDDCGIDDGWGSFEEENETNK